MECVKRHGVCNEVPVAEQLLIVMPAAHRDTPSLFFLGGTRQKKGCCLSLLSGASVGFPRGRVSLDGCKSLAQPSFLEEGCLPIALAVQVCRP